MDCIFLSSYSSIIESELFNIPLTTDLSKANYIVNYNYQYDNSKTLIVNLPLDFDLTDNFISIISRYPIGVENYKLDSYKTNSAVKNPSSLIILNKNMMNNLNDLDYVKSNSFILGLDTEIDGYLTAVGYKILN